jgi:hypothetical protein
MVEYPQLGGFDLQLPIDCILHQMPVPLQPLPAVHFDSSCEQAALKMNDELHHILEAKAKAAAAQIDARKLAQTRRAPGMQDILVPTPPPAPIAKEKKQDLSMFDGLEHTEPEIQDRIHNKILLCQLMGSNEEISNQQHTYTNISENNKFSSDFQTTLQINPKQSSDFQTTLQINPKQSSDFQTTLQIKPKQLTTTPPKLPSRPISNNPKPFNLKYVEMGFDTDIVNRSHHLDQDKDILEFLINFNELKLKGYELDHIQLSLQAFPNDTKKASVFIDHFKSLSEYGFDSQNIKMALIKFGNNRDEAFEYLVESNIQ